MYTKLYINGDNVCTYVRIYCTLEKLIYTGIWVGFQLSATNFFRYETYIFTYHIIIMHYSHLTR